MRIIVSSRLGLVAQSKQCCKLTTCFTIFIKTLTFFSLCKSFSQFFSKNITVFNYVKTLRLNKWPQAKCPPVCEMSVYGEYVYNMYVKKMPSKG